MSQISILNDELQKVANDELGEVPSRIPDDINALKLWIERQPHLRARTDDQFLIQFLRGCKYSLERAKEKLDVFFTLKSKYPQLFAATDVDNATFREYYNLGCFTILPKPLHDNGPRLTVFRFMYNASHHRVEDVFLSWASMNEIMMIDDPYACIHGVINIVDFAKATASHFFQLTPNLCKAAVSFMEKSIPLRIKKICYINTSAAAQQFFKILFPFFSEKLKQRMVVLGHDLEELAKHIPYAYLPAEYGGQNSSCQETLKDYNKTWEAYREYFKENAQFGTDEHLRLGKPLDLDDMFGAGGSFRQLNVD